MSGTGVRRPANGQAIAAIGTAGMPALVANLALGSPRSGSTASRPASPTRPCRPGCSGTTEARRAQSRATLPIRRVVGPADVAALAAHHDDHTAVTGATYDIDGGEQLI